MLKVNFKFYILNKLSKILFSWLQKKDLLTSANHHFFQKRQNSSWQFILARSPKEHFSHAISLRKTKKRRKHITFARGERSVAILKERRELQYWFANKQHKSFFYFKQKLMYLSSILQNVLKRLMLLTLQLMYYYWQLHWYSSAWGQKPEICWEIQQHYSVCFV